MQFPSRDLTLQYISTSYQSVVQTYAQGTASYFLDGMGYVLGFVPIASLGQQILTADQPVPFAITASYAMNGGGSGISASYATTASYAVTYSYANHVTIADRAYNADVADLAYTASYAMTTGPVISASHANFSDIALVSSRSINAATASFTLLCDLASNAYTSNYAETASYILSTATVELAQTASLALYALFCGTASVAFESTFSDTASLAFYSNYAGSASYAVSASTASNLTGWNFTNTSSNVNVLSSDVPVVAIATGSYNAAFFDYVALSGSNTRAGIVFGSWINGLINYTEVSSVDVGDTSKVTMSLALNGGNVQLLANVSDTTPWNIKALGRYL